MAFLLGGMVLAALGSKLQIPDAIYRFCVLMLLMRIGLDAGMSIREAELSEMLLPAAIAVLVGCAIVLVGRYTLALLPGVRTEDGIATAGLFGAVSASTLAATRKFPPVRSLPTPWPPASFVAAAQKPTTFATMPDHCRRLRSFGPQRALLQRAMLAFL